MTPHGRHATATNPVLALTALRMTPKLAVLTLSIALSACALTAPAPEAPGTPKNGKTDLTCMLPSNCVSTLDNSVFAPLHYSGSPQVAMALLEATLKTFPEATIVHHDALTMQVIFTTPAGFKDQVDFSVDPSSQSIDFRSRSLFGLFDFGKNRSRMRDFTSRFEQQTRP